MSSPWTTKGLSSQPWTRPRNSSWICLAGGSLRPQIIGSIPTGSNLIKQLHKSQVCFLGSSVWVTIKSSGFCGSFSDSFSPSLVITPFHPFFPLRSLTLSVPFVLATSRPLWVFFVFVFVFFWLSTLIQSLHVVPGPTQKIHPQDQHPFIHWFMQQVFSAYHVLMKEVKHIDLLVPASWNLRFLKGVEELIQTRGVGVGS